MKVMCIYDKPWDVGTGPSYRDIDEVLAEKQGYYGLKRFMHHGYLKKHFIVVEDIDETELVNQREAPFLIHP